MKLATIQLETLTCPSCMQKITNAVKKVEGVEPKSIDVLFNSSRVKVDFDDTNTSVEQIVEAINKVGYDVIKTSVKDK